MLRVDRRRRVWLLPLLIGFVAVACGRTPLESEVADGGGGDDFGSGGDGGFSSDGGQPTGGFSGGGGGGKAGSGGRGGSGGASKGGSGGFRPGGAGGKMTGGAGGFVAGGSGGGSFSQLMITPGSATIGVGHSTQYRALAVQNGTQRDVSTQVAWTVAPQSRATVVGSGANGGRVTGLDAGQVEVTATLAMLTAKARLQVVKDTLLSLRMSPDNVRVDPGGTSQLTVNGVFESGAVRNMTDAVVWRVDDPMLVEHTHLGVPGLLRAGMLEGVTTVRVAADGVEAALSVKVVEDNRLTLVVEPATANRRVGETMSFRALGVFEDGTQRNLTNTAAWTSSDPRVATVERGVARCFSSGDVVVVVSVDDVAATANLTCTDAVVTLLRLTPLETEVPVGTRLQYTATAFFSDGSSRNVTSATAFKTSDNAVATVSLRGLATAVGAGQATIEGAFEGASGQATFTAR